MPSTTDLRVVKASADSFTPLMASFEGSKCSVWPIPVTDCVGSGTVLSALRRGMIR